MSAPRSVPPTLPLLLALLALVAAACPRHGASRDERRRASNARDAAVAAAPRASLYDDEGRLRRSQAQFMGFVLPVGFERVSTVDGAFVYESREVAYAKLGSYVESQLESSTLEVAGRAGLIHRNAVVRGAEDPTHHMEVRVFTIPGAVQLWLRDLPPVVFPPGTTQEMRIDDVNRAWREERE